MPSNSTILVSSTLYLSFIRIATHHASSGRSANPPLHRYNAANLTFTVGTPKYIANKMKSKGLQRLRWFCQVCEKQCRDENGFKCHAQSEAHLRQMLAVGENAGRHISDFSRQFQSDFVQLLSRRFGTKRVKANTVYQEFIQDKSHLHMNATRWVTLTEFVKHLGRTGVARVDETEKGWFLAWIDNSPKALAKQVRIFSGIRGTVTQFRCNYRKRQ